jgi:hypothetical protein
VPEAKHVPDKIDGSCLCGAVRFRVTGKIGPAGQCHCSRCRKVSGTDGNAVFYAAANGLHWLSGEAQVRSYQVPNANGWTSRFCGTCGSPMPLSVPSGEGTMWIVPAGLLDDDPGFRGYAAHIHVASKAPWVEIADDAPQFAEGFGSERLNGG